MGQKEWGVIEYVIFKLVGEVKYFSMYVMRCAI